MKVGQTFLSAVLNVLLPQCRQKKGLRRLYSVGATGRSPPSRIQAFEGSSHSASVHGSGCPLSHSLRAALKARCLSRGIASARRNVIQ